jgi:predicted ribosome quality control (RQC) complex YloA/Tae2 family protein
VHNNFYFLRQLTSTLQEILSSAVVSECFSQNKDELIVRFEREKDPFFIRASLLSTFSCLSFPETFNRARRNSVDLFEKLIGQRVQGIEQFQNERSFAIHFSNDFSLLFKMHGNRANILLFEKGDIEQLFKNNIPTDATLRLDSLHRNIDWSYENFVQHADKPESVYFTLGKEIWKYLKQRGYDSMNREEQWNAIKEIVERIGNPIYYILDAAGGMTFSLIESGKTNKQFQDPIPAINYFFNTYAHQDAFSSEKAKAFSLLKATIDASENYLTKTRKKLHELQNDNSYKIWADLLMANLHAIPAGVDRVTLPDFYHDDRTIEIKIKKDLSPQKNAALFYKKSKNQQIEINHLEKLIGDKQKEWEKGVNSLAQLESANDLKSLRKSAENLKLVAKEKQAAPLPYREVEYNGYKIWIGKNAQSNDILTLRYGYKEDLWLHAKDVAGSHVLLKHQSGKNFPKDIIEHAAQLAAYHSKRKNETLCPVIVTPKKYVRKRKGDPAGMVVVEREEVIMVEPRRGK